MMSGLQTPATTPPAPPILMIDNEETLFTGSRNHSYVQSNLIITLGSLRKFVVYTELSLEIEGKEYKPDVCLYAPDAEPVSLARDRVKVLEMPLAAMEILSPKQNIETIMEKLEVYFRAGVKPCWLVIPSGHTVLVYTDLDTVQAFSDDTLADETLGIHLPLKSLFKQGYFV